MPAASNVVHLEVELPRPTPRRIVGSIVVDVTVRGPIDAEGWEVLGRLQTGVECLAAELSSHVHVEVPKR